MRIAICGTQCIGKSTLIEDFLKEWPMYKRSNSSYRQVLKEKQIPINMQTTKASQKLILDCLVDDIKATRKGDNIIFDRCPLDNVVYSLWALDKGTSDIDSAFIDECVPIIQEAMKNIDIVFFLPITQVAPVAIVPRDDREVDEVYRSEIDNIFKAIEHMSRRTHCQFFAKDDAPPIIEIFGTPRERIEMIKLYVNSYGDCVETVQSVLSDDNIQAMESLIREQQFAKEDEDKMKELKSIIVDPTKTSIEKELKAKQSKQR